jgi:ribonuclease R
LLSELQVLFELYQALQKQRKKRGTIEFEVDEPIFRFGEDGKIADIALRSRTVSHKIIEECMLAANVTVAKFLKQTKLPFLYRIHSTPSLERLEKLRDFLSNFALKLGGKNSPTAKDFSQLMEKVIERDDAHLIQTVVLRSMQQAVYSPENVGHFGLAYDSYCHFTSPIRRYPDLLVHRAIKHMLSGGQVKNFAYEKQSFQTLGEHLSITERRADRATREAMDRLKCEFMQDKVGENFSARIVDVTGFGLFVECNHIYVQGLLHISSLESDYYDHDNVAHCLRGRRGGKVYRLGDSIRVKVAKVDVDERTIDFVLQ